MRELTPRQLRVLQLRSQGLPIKTIAAELNCSVKSIDGHLRQMSVRFGARNPIHLIYLVTKQGVV